MFDFARARRIMVDCQIRTFDVTDRAVLAAFGEVPRELFMPPGREDLAYVDRNVVVPDAGGEPEPRYLLAPMVLARLVQALAIEQGSRVLDVASGSGYASAILSRLGADVVSLDRANARAGGPPSHLGPGQVAIRSGPIGAGAPQDGPFDAILINGAIETRPDTLLAQLADGGRLACLRTEGRTCRALLYVRSGDAVGFRALFDATAPTLAEFRPAREFAF